MDVVVCFMAKKSSGIDLPDWAQQCWENAGSPELSELESVSSGSLLDRRHGLRKDDLVEVMLDVRSLPADCDPWMRGRMLTMSQSSMELLTADGVHHYIARDVIVKIILIAHLRPAYIDDSELINYERADMKRRNKLHETVEKKVAGSDDAHLWG